MTADESLARKVAVVGTLLWAQFTGAAPAAAQNPATAESSENSPAGEAVIVPPKALAELVVDYPEGASGDAEVVVELKIGTDGVPSELQVVKGEEPFASVALAAARSWRFEPATRNGQPVAARIRVQVLFTEPARPADTEPETENEPEVLKKPQLPSPRPDEGKPPAPVSEAEEEPIEILVTGERSEAPKQMSRADVRQLPGAFGDPFRAIEAMPGVTPIASGLPYFYVRGAPPGNVGYFFDAIAVPTLYHAAVGPAVVHPAFIDTVALYSGAYPARYGRFSGGILAGESAKAGYKFRGEASIRLVDSGAMLEIPFDNDRGSLMLGGRYSYTGAVVSLLVPEVEVGYWDYQARAQYRLTERDRISLFSFGSYDFLSAENDFGQQETIYDVTFHRLDLRYDRVLSSRSALRLATTLGIDQTLAGGNDENGLQIRTRRIDTRVEFSHRYSPAVVFSSGADIGFSRFDIEFNDEQDVTTVPEPEPQVSEPPPPGLPEAPEPVSQAEQDAAFEDLFSSRDDWLGGGWAQWVLRPDPMVTVTPGIRLDVYAADGAVSLAPEPRISARFQVTPDVALVHDLGLAHQAPAFSIPVPGLQARVDKLQKGVQSSAGVEANLPHKLKGSVTLFHNLLFDGTDPLGLAQLDNADQSVNNDTDRVTGQSYGLEVYIRRPLTERLSGFLSYTLSRSHRSVGRLEGPMSFDRTHVVNFALAYELGRRWRAGGRFLVYTGIPAEVAYLAAASNPPRTPPYYRLDFRIEKRWLIGDSGAWWALVLEVLNTTLNKEVLEKSCYAYGCREQAIGPVTIPSIGVEAAF